MILMFDPLGLVSIISSIEMHSPPALSIFSCALAENFNATTFTFLSNSPLDKTLPGTKIVSSQFFYLTLKVYQQHLSK